MGNVENHTNYNSSNLPPSNLNNYWKKS